MVYLKQGQRIYPLVNKLWIEKNVIGKGRKERIIWCLMMAPLGTKFYEYDNEQDAVNMLNYIANQIASGAKLIEI